MARLPPPWPRPVPPGSPRPNPRREGQDDPRRPPRSAAPAETRHHGRHRPGGSGPRLDLPLRSEPARARRPPGGAVATARRARRQAQQDRRARRPRAGVARPGRGAQAGAGTPARPARDRRPALERRRQRAPGGARHHALSAEARGPARLLCGGAGRDADAGHLSGRGALPGPREAPRPHRERRQHPAHQAAPGGGADGARRGLHCDHLPLPRRDRAAEGPRGEEEERPAEAGGEVRMTRWTGSGLGLAVAAALAAATARAEIGAAPAGEGPAAVEMARTTEPTGDIPYDPAGRRDPVRPPRVGAPPHTGEQRTPLQRYEVAQLRLVAVIYDTRDPRAVVEDDQGLGYIIHVGTPIGPNGGQVRSIDRGRVLITEDAVDYYGEHRENHVTMELRTAERGK